MSWEANRWTAKSPAELYQVLGPQGVNDLIHQALGVCWRESPAEGRTLQSVCKVAREVFDRNMKVWSAIKKPSPAAFFENLLPNAADQYVRQAMVLCWMMMPRRGGRDLADVRRIVSQIFERNIASWNQDESTFTGKTARKTKRRQASSRPAIARKAKVKKRRSR